MGTLTRAAVGTSWKLRRAWRSPHSAETAVRLSRSVMAAGTCCPPRGPAPGDLVGDAHRHGIETQPTRDGRPVARLAWPSDTEGSAAECDKIPARSADDPGMTLIGPERESDQRRAGDLPHIAGV